MKSLKNEKGVTLLTVVIIVIVLIILAGIGITSGISTVRSAIYSAFNAEMQIIQTNVNEISGQNPDANALGQEMTDVQKSIFNEPEVQEVLNTKEGDQTELKAGFRYFSESYLNQDLQIAEATRDYYINMQERIIISTEPVEYEGTRYYMLEQMSTGVYNVQTHKTGNVEFNVNYEIVDTNQINIIVSNITANNYTNKWQIRYKLSNSAENWTTTPEFEGSTYTIVVKEKGDYDIEVFHKEEWQSETKQINVSGAYNETKGVNNPAIGGDNGRGLIPIKWNGENWEVCLSDDPTWYNYSDKAITVINKDGNQEQVEPMTWANAMLSDGTYKAGEVEAGQVVTENELGSMFVWIPRFAYSINEYKVKQDPIPADGTTQNITKVEFLKGTTNEGTSGNTYPEDYDVDSVAQGDPTPMIVHPAFNFGGQELEGFWVAKFEASMEEENLNTTANNNVTDKTVKILPNAESWRYIQIGNTFKNCLNMKENIIYRFSKGTDTHLMKNSEWGAAAYLAASQYGKIPAKNDSGSYDSGIYHSYIANGNYKANIKQSTTANVTGIYDMNGGAWEYVAAYWDNGSDSLENFGTKEIFPNNKLSSKYTNYFDKYEVGTLEITQGLEIWNMANTEGNNQLYKIAKDRVDLMKNIKGDAMYETINEWSYYGRYANTYIVTNPDGTKTEYKEFEFEHWFTPTINDKGELINSGEEILGQYGRCLYNDDFTLIGTYLSPFEPRGGTWEETSASGIFACCGYSGYANNNTRISTCDYNIEKKNKKGINR